VFPLLSELVDDDEVRLTAGELKEYSALQASLGSGDLEEVCAAPLAIKPSRPRRAAPSGDEKLRKPAAAGGKRAVRFAEAAAVPKRAVTEASSSKGSRAWVEVEFEDEEASFQKASR
jgi:hypothetical protein